ncbi:amino acid ABC transporter permease [uncultured Oscillibacter sp.]|uniref:amino acid ABC transporter permease n=1 Tax=uncultured Oscillibacter sp. TaxID=876091 RepID=UPI00260AE4BE|nr:amino acid ABC transporter permease [uncultured Oscillibacter sp.]
MPRLLTQCAKITLPMTVLSFVCGLLLALVLALVQVANIKGLKQFARFYVWVFRGTPLLVQIFIIFFGLPSLGIMIDGFPAAVIAFSLNFAAYNSEVLRSAIQAVPVGQTEAAYMVGLNYFQLMTRIVLPQAARIAFPPLFNSLIGLVKDTSLAATITVIDMLAVSKQIAARYYEPMPMYVETAIIYLVICTVLTKVQSYLEKKLEWKQPEDVGEEKPALSDTAKLE